MDLSMSDFLSKQFLAMVIGKGVRIVFVIAIAFIVYHSIKGGLSRIIAFRFDRWSGEHQKRTNTRDFDTCYIEKCS